MCEVWQGQAREKGRCVGNLSEHDLWILSLPATRVKKMASLLLDGLVDSHLTRVPSRERERES